MNEHQLISLIRRYRAQDKISPSLPTEVLFSVLQGELKRINFLNFEALLKGLEEKEDSLTKEKSKEERWLEEDEDSLSKEKTKKERNGMLPKEITRRTLIAILGAAKSQLRIHNVNHLIDALVKR